MEPLQFKEIRELLNACRLASIDDKPVESERGSWELYRGTYRVHVLEVAFEVLYFLADATSDSIKNARRTAFKPRSTFVVYAPSIKIKAALKAAFEQTAQGFWSTTGYLASFMSNELDAYRKCLQKLTPPHYIDPLVGAPAGTSHRFPNPLHLFLVDPETRAEESGMGSVAVVLAEAGHGKTYMCHSLVAKLASNDFGILPIFVSSSQWQGMRPEHLSSLGTTIMSSFRALGTTIAWVEGQEDLFLKVALKVGLFRIVFDGFDEYVLRIPGEVEVFETLSAISSLAAETGTRVLLTSRTSFWESEIPENQPGEPRVDDSNIYVYKIQPFSTDLARNYFKLRFPGEPSKVDRASGMFAELSKNDRGLAGRGFVLLLIAELVRSNQDLGAVEKPLLRLMRAHCERERKRQDLQLTAQQQLDALMTFSFEVALGTPPDSELLLYAVQLAAPDLSPEEEINSLEKMAPHALIERKGGIWQVRQKQVEVALLAMKLLSIVSKQPVDTAELSSFSVVRLDQGSETDLAAMLVALCLWERDSAQGHKAVQHLVSSLFIGSSGPHDGLRKSSLRRLATSVALRTLDESPQLNHLERTVMLRQMFPDEKFDGVVFFGGLARFDWTDCVFESCIFDNVSWVNSSFGSSTEFRRCYVFGGVSQHCTDFADVRWLNCQLDEGGRQFCESMAVNAGKKAYSIDHLRKDLSSILDKFQGKGGIGFKSLSRDDLGKGKIAVSIHKDQILEVVKKRLLEEHHISGQGGGGLHVKEGCREALQALYSNNAWTGELLSVVEELGRKLGALA